MEDMEELELLRKLFDELSAYAMLSFVSTDEEKLRGWTRTMTALRTCIRYYNERKRAGKPVHFD